MAIVAERTQTRLVTAAVAAIHHARCGEVVVTDLATMAPELELADHVDVVVCGDAVEIIADGALDALLPVVANLPGETDVVVLVDAARMGDAHRTFRRIDCVLQPWWRSNGTVSFGSTELP
ncbi:MAG: hypothetical protein HKN07_08205 [Acidimicrobiia bacterium]|nr:hypothetical protein [Acidimicrobiia bacterium]NNF64231.1 hypothetical protein [Acidimicrobiia bacterium]